MRARTLLHTHAHTQTPARAYTHTHTVTHTHFLYVFFLPVIGTRFLLSDEGNLVLVLLLALPSSLRGYVALIKVKMLRRAAPRRTEERKMEERRTEERKRRQQRTEEENIRGNC